MVEATLRDQRFSGGRAASTARVVLAGANQRGRLGAGGNSSAGIASHGLGGTNLQRGSD